MSFVAVGLVVAVFVVGGFAFFRIWLRVGRDVRAWRSRHGDATAKFRTVMPLDEWRRFFADEPPRTRHRP